MTPLRIGCESADAMPTRRAVLRTTLGAAVAAGVSLAAYATVIEPWLRLVLAEYRPRPPGWPADLPLSVAVLADLHAGEPLMPLARIEAIVAAANALRPDLIVLLGDYAASHRYVTRPVPMREVARALAALRAPLGVHAIAGNHDWWDDPEAMRRRGAVPPAWSRVLEEAGLPVMSNAAPRPSRPRLLAARSRRPLGLPARAGRVVARRRRPARHARPGDRRRAGAAARA